MDLNRDAHGRKTYHPSATSTFYIPVKYWKNDDVWQVNSRYVPEYP